MAKELLAARNRELARDEEGKYVQKEPSVHVIILGLASTGDAAADERKVALLKAVLQSGVRSDVLLWIVPVASEQTGSGPVYSIPFLRGQDEWDALRANNPQAALPERFADAIIALGLVNDAGLEGGREFPIHVMARGSTALTPVPLNGEQRGTTTETWLAAPYLLGQRHQAELAQAVRPDRHRNRGFLFVFPVHNTALVELPSIVTGPQGIIQLFTVASGREIDENRMSWAGTPKGGW
jgi:hypothetical protein